VISKMTNLTKLNIGYNRDFTPKGITCLAQLNLVELDAPGCMLNTFHLKEISRFGSLSKLNLCLNAITDQCLSHFSVLTGLHYLDLSLNKTITAVGLTHIVCLPIEELTMDQCNVEESHLQVIARITALRSLSLKFCSGLTSDGLMHITPLPLSNLSLGHAYINDSQVQVVGMMTSLSVLDLSSTLITDKAIECLSELRNLRTLIISSCPYVSALGLKSIAHLPITKLFTTIQWANHADVIAEMKQLKLIDTSVSIPRVQSLLQSTLQGSNDTVREQYPHIKIV